MLLIHPPLLLPQYRSPQTRLPLPEEHFLAFADEFPVPAVVEAAAVGVLLGQDFPSAGHEPEVRPAEEPEEGEVEEPSDPPLGAGGVLPAGGEDGDAAVGGGEGDFEVPAVIG